MVYNVDATDQTGSHTQIATEDVAEALLSLRAFTAASFAPVVVYDELGRRLLESDLQLIVAKLPQTGLADG